MRVYELAKKLNVPSKKMVAKCHELGMTSKNNFSGLSDAEVALINAQFGAGKDGKKGAALKQKKTARSADKPATIAAPVKEEPVAATPPVEAPAAAAQAPVQEPAKVEAKTEAPAPSGESVPPAPAEVKPAPQPASEPQPAPEAKAAPAGKVAAPTDKTKAPEAKAKPEDASRKPKAGKRGDKGKKKSPAGGVAPVVAVDKKGGSRRPVSAFAKGVPGVDSGLPNGAKAPAVGKRRARPWERQDGDDETREMIAQALRGGAYIQATPVSRGERGGRKRKPSKRTRRFNAAPVVRKTEFRVVVPISVKDLSSDIGIKANMLLLKLMQMGVMANINTTLDGDQVDLLAQELKLTIETVEAATAENAVEQVEQEHDEPGELASRAPVVTFLGHVDHGKTSLLDRIRQSDVVAHEHGGITQHIGAYRVSIADKTVVFLDTPGHEAFTAMRARGANVTDIVTLIVAADDGVMPQTEEAIDHAKAAGVPIVVAINKCDKPEANPNRVKQQLSGLGLQPEEWGGDTVCVEVSATTGDGVDDLIEMLSLVAELRELKANPTKRARGTVLEAQMSESHGPVATVLVQDGTLHVGDVLVIGNSFGRVKALISDKGAAMREAGPSWPVSVVGLDALPGAGDRLVVLDDIQQARAVAEERRTKDRERSASQRQHVSLENLFSSIEEGRVQELRLILKADVRGTLEAVSQLVEKVGTAEVKTNILRTSVGPVSTSDVLLADASDAVIVGMNVGVDTPARSLAEEKGVSVRVYNVIYKIKEEIEKALSGMLAPEEREVIAGHAEVRRTFKISRFGTIAGSYVTDGALARNNQVRLLRDGLVVFRGRMASLRREKDDVRDVRDGFECGILLDGFDDVKEGDVVEAYYIEKVARTLESSGS